MLFGAELVVALATAAPRVAVFGGSGFVGSRVCQTLVGAGCDVVSVSRTGQPPAWAAAAPWSGRVEWRSADALLDEDLPLGTIDGAVSCVGNMRPSPAWSEFFGLHWDYETMVRENGVVNERIAAAAKAAGATKFVLLSVASSVKWAYGGSLEGYIDGKQAAEATARRCFGDDGVSVVGPTLVYGGGRFAKLGPTLAKLCDSGAARGNIKFTKALKDKTTSGYSPQDAVSEVALTPPSDVDAVARVVCACLLGTVSAEQAAAFTEDTIAEDRIRDKWNQEKRAALGAYDFTFVDGADQIKRVADETATPALLEAAAQAWASSGATAAPPEATSSRRAFGLEWTKLPRTERGSLGTGELEVEALSAALASEDPLPLSRCFSRAELEAFGVDVDALTESSYVDLGYESGWLYKAMGPSYAQSPSSFGAPNEGALYGFRPFLYPWPPAVALVGSFATACIISLNDAAAAQAAL